MPVRLRSHRHPSLWSDCARLLASALPVLAKVQCSPAMLGTTAIMRTRASCLNPQAARNHGMTAFARHAPLLADKSPEDQEDADGQTCCSADGRLVQ